MFARENHRFLRIGEDGEESHAELTDGVGIGVAFGDGDHAFPIFVTESLAVVSRAHLANETIVELSVERSLLRDRTAQVSLDELREILEEIPRLFVLLFVDVLVFDLRVGRITEELQREGRRLGIVGVLNQFSEHDEIGRISSQHFVDQHPLIDLHSIFDASIDHFSPQISRTIRHFLALTTPMDTRTSL